MIEEILEVMRKRGIQKKEMAEMIGISESSFYNKATGDNDFTVSEMEKMCMILGIRFQLFHADGGWDIEAWRKKRVMETGNPRRKQRKDTK